MREKLPSLVKIHLITVLMTACSAGGNCILGVAYTSAAFEGRLAGWAGLAISGIVMFLSADPVLFTKYAGILAVMAAFTIISRTMNREKGENAAASEDIRRRSLYAGIGMALMELTDRLFGVLTLRSVGIALWYGVSCGILTNLFAKGVHALLAGEISFRRQRSEEMISAACCFAAAAYAVINVGFLPDYVLQSLICFLLLYVGYSCGPAMGAVTGAAIGVVLSFSFAEISYLGILCFLGLLCGMFRELGRFAQAIALIAGAACMMFCGVPFLTELRWLTGVLTAGGLWILCDMLLTIREHFREKRGAAECAGTMPEYRRQSADPGKEGADRTGGPADTGVLCADLYTAGDDRMAEILGIFAREVSERTEKEEYDNQRMDTEGRFWAAKYLETRDTLAVWMSEAGEILKNRQMPGNSFVKPEENLTEMLKKRFAGQGIRMHDVRQKRNPDGRMILRFLWSAGTGGERKPSRTVMVKDLVPIINDSLGMVFESSGENRSLVGKEQAVYEFVQTPNFKILHGSATTKKSEEDGNGDTFGVTGIGQTQVLFGIADGVGSGRDAADAAAHTLEQLEQLLKSGISEETSLRLIDSMEILKDGQGAALDFGVINLNTGICHLLKAGGAPGFILRGSWVEMMDTRTLPLGLLPGASYEQKVKKLYDGDVVLLLSDGVFQAFPGEDRAEEIGNYLTEISEMGPKEMARCLLDRALSFGKAADDMSVLAIGVYET
ncbi:MAG: serine/threonine-protein phosphatase [Lachnospiraceae bacterium]|nr:serine/threonine-protein phosphatase [Lachnospiraceae bacterium]